MKKKIMMIIGLIGILIPINTKALTGKVEIGCETNTLSPNKTTTCTIQGDTDEEVSAVSITLSIGDNLTLTNVTPDSSWMGDGENGQIELYTDTNKKGKFPIVTFTVKASNITTGADANITLNNVVLSDANFEETAFTTMDPFRIRIPSTINTLSSITIDENLIEGFDKNKTEYELIIDSSKKSINIDAKATDANTKITGDTGVKELVYGTNTFTITSTSEQGVSKTYQLTILKEEVRNLKKITINGIELSLKENIYEYSYTVENEITSIDLDLELTNEELASFVEDYGIRKINNLKEGPNEILIKIKDVNDEELTYKIKVNRLVKEIVKEENKEEIKEETSNPKTGNKIGLGIVLIIIIISAITFIISKFIINKNSR